MLTAGKDNTLRLVDLRTLRPRLTLRASGYAVGGVWTGAALGPDERHAAAGALYKLNRNLLHAVGVRAGPQAVVVKQAPASSPARHGCRRTFRPSERYSNLHGLSLRPEAHQQITRGCLTSNPSATCPEPWR